MEKFNSQAETHSKRPGPPRTSSPTHAETHSRPAGPPRTLSPSCVYFFLFLYRLQAQAQAHATAAADQVKLARFFIDSLENVGYLNESTKG